MGQLSNYAGIYLVDSQSGKLIIQVQKGSFTEEKKETAMIYPHPPFYLLIYLFL